MTCTVSRRALAASAALGVLAAVPVLASATAPATAATTTTNVAYTQCDVRTTANNPSTRVGPVFGWTPSLTVDLATPVQVNDAVDGRVTVGDFPADRIPPLTDVYSYYTGYLKTSSGSITSYGKTLFLDGEIVAGQPVPLGESEDEYTFGKAGLHTWFADEFTMNVEGYDANDVWRRYYVKCDEPAVAQQVAQIPVWDPAAKAAIAVSTTTPVQGGAVRLRGTGFRPDESVRFLIDGAEIGATATSLIGEAERTWTIDPFLRPGVHRVSLTSTVSAKSVSMDVTVRAAAASAKVAPKKVKRGKRTTVSGAAFKPGEKVAVVVRRTSAGKGLRSKKIATLTAAANGAVKKKVKLAKKFAPGKHQVTLTGATSGRVGVAKLKVKM